MLYNPDGLENSTKGESRYDTINFHFGGELDLEKVDQVVVKSDQQSLTVFRGRVASLNSFFPTDATIRGFAWHMEGHLIFTGEQPLAEVS